MKLACYLWSETSGRNRDRRRDELMRWLSQSGNGAREIEWYLDQGTSAAPERRAFDRLQEDILGDKVKEVVLWKLDHISRRFKDVATTIAAWCDRGVKIVVVGQQIELGAAVGQDVAALLRGLATTERDFRRKRQRAGIVAAKKRGVYPGRRRGTTKGKPAQALELKDKGLTTKEIAQALGVSERTVFRYLGTSEEIKRPVARKGAKS